MSPARSTALRSTTVPITVNQTTLPRKLRREYENTSKDRLHCRVIPLPPVPFQRGCKARDPLTIPVDARNWTIPRVHGRGARRRGDGSRFNIISVGRGCPNFGDVYANPRERWGPSFLNPDPCHPSVRAPAPIFPRECEDFGAYEIIGAGIAGWRFLGERRRSISKFWGSVICLRGDFARCYIVVTEDAVGAAMAGDSRMGWERGELLNQDFKLHGNSYINPKCCVFDGH